MSKNHTHYGNVAFIDVCGDELEARWTGSVWTNGPYQASTAREILQVELYHYLLACGEKLDSVEDAPIDAYDIEYRPE